MNSGLSKQVSKRLQEIFSCIESHTLHIFHNDRPQWESGYPSAVGTGVLLKYDEKYYLVTAAHVVKEYATQQKRDPYKEEDEYDDPSEARLSLVNLGFYSNGFFYPLQRVVYTTTGCSVVDRVDLAVIPLDNETANELLEQNKQFVCPDAIATGHTVSKESRYFVYGYPGEGTYVEGDKIKRTPFQMNTRGFIVSEEIGLRYDPQYNIFIEYNPKKLVDESGNRIDMGSPNGISGCGLWYYNEDNRLVLVGIMIENKLAEENVPAMMATRIDEVIYMIKTNE